MNELRDFRGTPILVGSRILYPCRASSSVWMNEAEVKSINEDKTLTVVPVRSSDTWNKFNGRATRIYCVGRVAVVQ